MKSSRILLFILSIIVTLAVMCAFFPQGGMHVGDMELRFPTLEEVLVGDESDSDEPQETPEQAQARMEQEMKMLSEKEKFLYFFQNDSSKFTLPGGDLTFFDDFFASLDNARTTPVRVMHYGDSQIEEDRISKALRARLQERFGGSGPGLLPLRNRMYTITTSEYATRNPRRYMVFGPSSGRPAGNKYGPMGYMSRLDSSVTVTISTSKRTVGSPTHYFNRVTVLSGNIRSKLYIWQGSQKETITPGTEPIQRTTFQLPDSTVKVAIGFAGGADIYGIMLGDSLGVSVDNVPMRGCSGTIFTNINADQLANYYNTENVRLIMLQYGGNMMPFTRTPQAISNYKQKIEKQIEYIQSLAPKAKIVFIGPSDMSTSMQGRMQTYNHLPMMVDSLKAAANNSGAAFWDIYAAMGGRNSMPKWVKSNPALAGQDYIHFTQKGADMVGDMLTNSLMTYYEYYKWRQKNEIAEGK